MSDSNIGAAAPCAQDRADVTAGVILQIVNGGLREWFYREPIHVDDLRARVADAIRDHDRDLQTDLLRDLPLP
jgi:hypothetical protein